MKQIHIDFDEKEEVVGLTVSNVEMADANILDELLGEKFILKKSSCGETADDLTYILQRLK